MIPFPPFEPDKSPFNASASYGTLNALPASDGWKSMASLTEVSDALPGECLGYIKAQTSDNELTVIAGTQTDLYKLDTSTTPYSWVEVSKVSGGYNVPIGDRWNFVVFGDHIIACNLGTILQSYDLNSPTTFADVTGAPTARSLWITSDYLCAGHLLDDPNRMAWSGLNDYSHWVYGRKGSDTQIFPDGGEILGGFGAQNGGIVIQRDSIRYQNFSPNSGYTFTFSEANNERGALSQFSFVNLSPSLFFYLSKDGFFSGVNGTPIGSEKVDEWFFDNIDPEYLKDVRGFADPFENIVWWLFRTIDGTRRMLGYDWQLNRWCLSDQNLSDAGPLLTSGVTWDGLASFYSSIDNANVPFDSRAFKGGFPALAAFTTDNKLAYFTGTTQAATLQTAEVALNPDNRTFVNSGHVETDAKNFTATIAQTDYHGNDLVSDPEVTPSSRTKKLSFRSSGKIHQITINIPAGEQWSTIKGIILNGIVEGKQ